MREPTMERLQVNIENTREAYGCAGSCTLHDVPKQNWGIAGVPAKALGR